MMQTWSIYDLATGHFTGAKFSAADDTHLEGNTPQGCGARLGAFHPGREAVDIESGEIVPYQPDAPPDTDLKAWAWDEDQGRWVGVPTTAALAIAARQERDRLLSACDWVRLRADDLGEAMPGDWLTYRQALRDVPEQAGFPTSIDWPTPPG